MIGTGCKKITVNNNRTWDKYKAAVKVTFVIGIFLFGIVQTSGALGPFEVSDPNDSVKLQLQLASQLLSVWESEDSGANGDRETSLVMKVRRIRPTLRLTLPDYRTSFKLHLSLAPGSVELMDFCFDATLSKHLRIRVGQYKIPFTRYRIQSFQRLTFVDWSLVTKYFGGERQMGFSVHNGYEKPLKFGYVLGVFNGVNARSSHTTRLASLFGEKIVNRSDLTKSTSAAEFHPEVVGHLSYNSTGMDARSDTDPERGPLRYCLASSVAWDFDPEIYEETALRIAQEFLIKYRGWSLMGAGYAGFMAVDNSQRTRLAFSGGLVQSAYRMSERVEVSARYAVVDIESTVANAAYNRAQTIIAGTTDTDVIAQYKNAGLLRAEQEGTIGINVYLDSHNLKWQNDFGFTTSERRDEDLTDFTVRSQIQLAF